MDLAHEHIGKLISELCKRRLDSSKIESVFLFHGSGCIQVIVS
jgi:hypothetical protein